MFLNVGRRLSAFAAILLIATTARADICSPVVHYFTNWFARVDDTKAEQPAWPPVLLTPSPALQEVLRYDISYQTIEGSHTTTTFGCGKGLDIIPAEKFQITFGMLPWQIKHGATDIDGWADQSFAIKYRIMSANAQNGDYVLSTSLGVTVPNGSAKLTTHHYVITPCVGFGKGWGDFNIQSSAGVSVPENDAGRRSIGTPVAINLAGQYRVAKVFWPDVELNYSYYPNGPHEGLNQAFVTPGLLCGKFPVWKRLSCSAGVGYQVAVTEHPLYRRALLFTFRLPF